MLPKSLSLFFSLLHLVQLPPSHATALLTDLPPIVSEKFSLKETDCGVFFARFADASESYQVIRIQIPRSQIPKGLHEEDIVRFVFDYHAPFVAQAAAVPVKGTATAVTEALIGPPEGRPAYVEISATNRASIAQTAKQYMNAKLPIEGVTFWGGAKSYGIGDHLGIDAADLLAILRYESINESVKAAGYAPGIKVQLIFEDLGRRFMGGDTADMKNRVEKYQNDMEKLVRLTGPSVKFTPESAIIERNEVPLRVRQILGIDPKAKMTGSEELFFLLAQKSEGILFRYLRATEQPNKAAPLTSSDSKGFLRVEKLPEFRELESLGFKGGLPQDQRRSVRERTKLRLGNPDISEEELDKHVAKYFAQGFARAMFNLRLGTSVPKGASEPLPTLSYSFLPYPPGTPASMIVRRVELSAATDTGQDKVVPCWGGCAVLNRGGNLQLRAKVKRPERVINLMLDGEEGTKVTVPLHFEE